jgi:glycosyltransferase involved in cell wall biosynthesis
MKSSQLLFNLLPYRPAATGLSRYAERLLSSWRQVEDEAFPLQLRLNVSGSAEFSRDPKLPKCQSSRLMRWLQSNALVQHALNIKGLVAKLGPSAIYSPYTDYLFGIRDVPQIITCHDLTPLCFPSSRRAYWRSRLWLPLHLKRATSVIAISQSVADHLVNCGVPTKRIEVIPNGVETIGDPIVEPIGHDFLILARHALNKNIGLALKGFSRFLGLEPEWPGRLVVVGNAGGETSLLKQLESELGLYGRVLWLEHLDERQLQRQMRASFCLISSSLMEGFDYPLLEAQALGLPTLASKISVHCEFHCDKAILFELHDDGIDLAHKLSELAASSSLWQDLSLRGISNSKLYSLSRQVSSIKTLLESQGLIGG